ncbi:MAG TPA: valine--tRNA ligase [Thermomicrobiales bacterium]|nr:valine--tRNA ligase [Thermomicrobiales bacterium]
MAETRSAGADALAKTYDPRAVERDWYNRWDAAGAFAPAGDPKRPPYVIIMPPPNVTGELHMGHALFVAVEDIFTRWRRMQGYPTLWLPGADHAGIAGQWVVEKEIAAEGLTRHDLGRERFLARVWDWMDRYRGRIREQLRILGASCDWSRFAFTMDPGPARAVRVAFKHLYDKGLIYRGRRMINWCPRCMTALSDLEVNYEDETGSLWYVRYPIADEPDRWITVATTRPETILGDTGVAVHPGDARYADLVGKEAILPVLGRRLPIVADEAVDPEFGTGAVKVTPAHDPVDFEIGERHGLPAINVMNLDGTMNDEAGPFAGQTTMACRLNLVQWLREHDQLVKEEPHTHSVGHCDRCDTIVEPLISEQWFVKMAPLAAPAIAAAKDGAVTFFPERFTTIYLRWMENVYDWCISRQLWWGHRIPVWYCAACGERTVSVEETVERCAHCGSAEVAQDPDVLDTWFSSGLWPFSTLGWPDDTPDLRRFYPGTLMETGYDIIFLWVARMIFLGLEFIGEPPFQTVYLHGTVRDEAGRRMSKTKGNVLDPTEVTAEFGSDALRFTLITAGAPGADMKLSVQAVEASRNFANKIWQATRFVLANCPAGAIARDADGAPAEPDAATLNPADRWILSRLSRVTAEATRQLEALQLGKAADELYAFIWSEFADWYVEAAKVRLHGEDEAAKAPVRQTLVYTLERTLRLLHSFMPFVTEELWQALPHGGDLLICAPWPAPNAAYPAEEAAFARMQEATRAIRNARAERGVEPGRRIAAIVAGPHAGDFAALAPEFAALARIARDQLTIAPDAAPERAVTLALDGATVYLPLAGLVDLDAERARLAADLAAAEAEAGRAGAMLANEGFTSRAPANVVQVQRDRLAAAEERARLLHDRLATLA